MTESLRLEGNGKVIDLYPWLSNTAKGVEALKGILGFGLPAVTNQWFDGAGSGSTWRGARVGRRVISLPVWVYAQSRGELAQILSDLSVALDPLVPRDPALKGVARLFFGMPDDDEWYIDVVRTGGLDWKRKEDSDDRTYFKTSLQLEAGDAFWTRNRAETFEVRRDVSGAVPTLLPRLAKLRLASGAAFGVQEVSNIGDTFAWPMVKVNGPTSKITLIGANGETLIWDSARDSLGVLPTGRTMLIDMRNNIVEDNLGNNRYDGLAPAPKFWSIAPGESIVTVQADNIDDSTTVYAQWWPRRQAVI